MKSLNEFLNEAKNSPDKDWEIGDNAVVNIKGSIGGFDEETGDWHIRFGKSNSKSIYVPSEFVKVK